MTASPTDDLASAERGIQELTKELSQARGKLEDGLIVPVALRHNTAEFGTLIHENFPRPVDTSSNLGRAQAAREGRRATHSRSCRACAGLPWRGPAIRGQLQIFDADTGALLSRKDAFIPA